MARLSPYAFVQEMDNNGDPLVGGKLYTYEAGTTTPKATYTNSGGAVANANPIILDASGRADIWLGSGAYKFVLKTSADATIKTVDNIAGDTTNSFVSDVFATSVNTSITSAYRGALVNCTATLTLSLDSAATLGENFYFTMINTSVSGVVTIDPNGSETINGAATLTITAGQSAVIVCTGTNWLAVLKTTNVFETISVTGVSTLTGGTRTGAGAFIAGKGIEQIEASIGGGNPATSGSTDPNNIQTWKGGAVELRLGVYASGNFWLQGSAAANYATNYSLYLNPSGGEIHVPTASPGDNSTKSASTAFVTTHVTSAIPAAFTGSNQSLAANGYQKLPGGVILQWGTLGSVGDNSATTVTLPIAAPTYIAVAMAGVDNALAGGSTEFNVAGCAVLSLTQISVQHNTGPTSGFSDTVRWFVLCW
jgi:hypothetical protein